MNKQEYVISFRVSSDERDKLYELARSSGVSISGLMRRYLHATDCRKACSSKHS